MTNEGALRMEEIPNHDEGKEEPEQNYDQGPRATSERTIVGLRWVSIVLAVLSSTFFFGLDNTVVAVVQPIVVDRFNSLDRLPWISVAFLVGAAATNFF